MSRWKVMLATCCSSALLAVAAGAGAAGAAAPASPLTDVCKLMHLKPQLTALHVTTGCATTAGLDPTGTKTIGAVTSWRSGTSMVQLNIITSESQAKFYSEGENNGTAGGPHVGWGSGSRSEASPIDAQLSAYSGGVGIWIRVTHQARPGKTNTALIAPILALAKAAAAQV